MDATRQGLVLALPSKGRLSDQTRTFLSECGLDIRPLGNGREYAARLSGISNVSVVYFRPEEIPTRIEQGDAHAGITGEDLYREYAEGPPASCLTLAKLGFGAARLVIAVPQSWVDVSSINDLDESATLFHQRHGKSLRVATKFSRLTRLFFSQRGLVEYSLVESLGATEGAPSAGVADLVVDLTSTGKTMSENYLKEISGGTVLETQGCLIGSLRENLWSEPALGAFEHIIEQVEARLRARSSLTLRFSLPSAQVNQVETNLTKKYDCVISAHIKGGQQADDREYIIALCSRPNLYGAVNLVRANGGLELMVDHCEFLFGRSSPAFEAFKQMLRRRNTVVATREMD